MTFRGHPPDRVGYHELPHGLTAFGEANAGMPRAAAWRHIRHAARDPYFKGMGTCSIGSCYDRRR